MNGYRPQFAFAQVPPQGMADVGLRYETSEEYFDSSRISGLAAFPSTAPRLNISLPLDTDWVEFRCRGIKIGFNNTDSQLKHRIRTSRGDYLSSDWVLLTCSYEPSGGGGPNPGPFRAGGQPVVFEAPILLLPGDSLLIDIADSYTNQNATPAGIILVGEKVYRECK